jgi:putative ABC transport system permease protein
VIGVTAVIAMVTIGNGTTAKVEAEMSKLGSNLLFIRPGQFGPGRASSEAKAFNVRDIEALREQLRNVRAIAPVSRTSQTVIYGTESRTVSITGTDNAYFTTQNHDVIEGREFLDSEVRGGQAACVIGTTVREELFGSTDPVGRKIRVSNVSCEVIGLLEEKGESSFGNDQDDIVLLPLRTLQRRLAGSTDIDTIYVSANDKDLTTKVQADVELLLRERRNITSGKDDDFSVADTQQIAATQTATTSMLTLLLAAVAGVSLLVGGIGIMNIMLVSVTERTREIGIRLAIGAEERQVLMQFLVEAVVLSVIGGVAGVVIGLTLAGAASLAMNIPFVLDVRIVVLAFGFSALVGIVFGYFPARQAAQMNPIEALRHE